MPPPQQDSTFRPGCYVFGFTVPGLAYFGNARTYPQQAIFGTRPFGGEIPGVNMEAEVFRFISGPASPRATGPWGTASDMSCRHHGLWAKRIVFYQHRGRQMMRRYTPADSAPKNLIMPYTINLMAASFLWHCLTDEAKRRLNGDAARLGLKYSGYNYFTKLYIEDDPKYLNYV